jgi:glycine cleavage system H protein
VIPEDLLYTDDHEWVRVTSGGTVRVGITDYAQRQLGDIVFLQLPEVGQRIDSGDTVGEVESTKSVSDLFAPLGGEVIAVNETLADQPELVNSEPYDAGWIFDLKPDEPVARSLGDLLDADAYRSLTDQS